MCQTDIYQSLKRIVDAAAAFILLLLLSPLLLILATAVRLKLGSPILFRQARSGRNGTAFSILKFRTLTESRDANGQLLDDESRMTPFGRWMRHYSLDELPSILNILRGQMSFVGPRPFVADYLDRYTDDEFKRHSVRPGLTGLAQVSGRNSLSWDDKLSMDVWYADHVSIDLDLRILTKTLIVIVRPSNVTAVGHASMPEFRPRP